MMRNVGELSLLAALLRYPEESYQQTARRCLEALGENFPEAGLLLSKFVEQTRDFSIEEFQALYTSTFDLDPMCALEVGWHLFGEKYERGEFLVKMRGVLRRLLISESAELPDHLTYTLVALERMGPSEGAEFAAACLFPALDKMHGGLQGKGNPFEYVLLSVVRVLESQYPRPDVALPAAPEFRILDSGVR